MGYSKSAIKPELLTILLIYLNSLLLKAKTSEELLEYFIASWCMHMIGSSTIITLVHTLAIRYCDEEQPSSSLSIIFCGFHKVSLKLN